jgi:hypothetical protein
MEGIALDTFRTYDHFVALDYGDMVYCYQWYVEPTLKDLRAAYEEYQQFLKDLRAAEKIGFWIEVDRNDTDFISILIKLGIYPTKILNDHLIVFMYFLPKEVK